MSQEEIRLLFSYAGSLGLGGLAGGALVHQLRLAAADRRIEAHQQAYSLWRQLLAHIHQEGIAEAVIACEKWWDNNCLYLTPEARRSFYVAAQCAFSHSSYLRPGYQNADLVKSNWQSIIEAGEVIVRGVELPSLGEAEYRSLVPKSEHA